MQIQENGSLRLPQLYQKTVWAMANWFEFLNKEKHWVSFAFTSMNSFRFNNVIVQDMHHLRMLRFTNIDSLLIRDAV